MNREKPDIIFLTETKTNVNMLSLNLYNTKHSPVIRKARPIQNSAGGGIAILVKKHLIVDDSSLTNLEEHIAQEVAV